MSDRTAEQSFTVPTAEATVTGQPANKPRNRKPCGPTSREETVSRALSKLLRHQASNARIQLDPKGFAPLDKVLEWGPLKSQKVTFQDVQDCVKNNAKQRFSMKLKQDGIPESETPSDWLIRANQGHTIKIESSALLTEVMPENIPQITIHGTFFAFWASIIACGGLSRMNRNHIHCAEGIPGEDQGVISGMRGDAELLIEIDIESSMKDGIKWWKSTNGVILTEGNEQGLLLLRYFKKVTGRKVDVGILVENGDVIGELPNGLKMKTPQGKSYNRNKK